MNDNELDQLIKESLNAEEAAYYETLDEQHILNRMTLIYKGKDKWMSIIQSVAMVGIFGFGVYCALQFFAGDDVIEMLKWGFGALFAWVATGTVKLMLVQLMQEKNLIREMKRLEFQIAHLGKDK